MLKLLIADDEYHIVNHLNRLLSRLDCCETDLLCAYSGPAAMDLILSSRIDVAFLDINMPKINGLLWSSFFVTLVAKKYRLATMLPFVPRMVCDSR